MAISSLQKSEAMTKHVVCISDGDPQPPSDSVLNAFKSSKITCTTVAVAAHGPTEQQLLKRIATTTGGRFYQVNNPKALPQIYIKETRVVSRPLIFERPSAWSPRTPCSPSGALS